MNVIEVEVDKRLLGRSGSRKKRMKDTRTKRLGGFWEEPFFVFNVWGLWSSGLPRESITSDQNSKMLGENRGYAIVEGSPKEPR